MSNETLLFWIFLIVGLLIYLWLTYARYKISNENLRLHLEHQKDLDKKGLEHEKNNKVEIQIYDNIWMTKNLNADKYQNGEEVFLCQTEDEWQQANEKKIPASCYYNFDASLAQHYGRLYNWYAVNDPRGLAPKGWKVPTYEEFNELNEDASNLKSRTGWKKDKGGNNSLGFSAVPSGVKNDECELFLDEDFLNELDREKMEVNNGFFGQGMLVGFWTATEQEIEGVGFCKPKKKSSDRGIALVISENSNYIFLLKSDGLSVRCIKEDVYASTEITKQPTIDVNNSDDYKEKYIKLLEAEVERLKNEKK